MTQESTIFTVSFIIKDTTKVQKWKKCIGQGTGGKTISGKDLKDIS